MIQFNLLPEVKLDYVKTRRRQRLITLVCLALSAVSLSILIILFVIVNIFQRQHSHNLSHDIEINSKKLKDTPELAKVLTIQNQLTSLPTLHANKPVASRLFKYLSQLTPSQPPQEVGIAKFDIDFVAHTIAITGSADSLSTINQFVDTLKFTSFVNADKSQQGLAFSNVQLVSFGRDTKGASYQIGAEYDKAIFESVNNTAGATEDVTLTVPKIITTRSQIQKPSDLFQRLSNPDLSKEVKKP